MTSARPSGTHNMKAVVRATGLAPDTLRAWERRYGVPSPTRTPGGHRLYSDHDVELLRWLAARQKEGLSIARAVALWRRLQASGRSPLAPVVPAAPGTPGTALDGLRAAWLDAVRGYDEVAADAALDQALASFRVEDACVGVLQRGRVTIGEWWYRGEMSVQQEHFASELAVRRVERLIAAAPPLSRSAHVLVVCPPEEEHIFAPLLLTLFLRRQGWAALFLGANVPLERLDDALEATRPELVVLCAQQLATAGSLLDAARLVWQAGGLVGYGGRIFRERPASRALVPGHYLGDDLLSAARTAGARLSQPGAPRPPHPSEAPPAYATALAELRLRLPWIEADVLGQPKPGIGAPHLDMATRYLARNLAAALKLGDLSLLDAEIDWLDGLLANAGIDSPARSWFFGAYLAAAKRHLAADRATPILDWLRTIGGHVS